MPSQNVHSSAGADAAQLPLCSKLWIKCLAEARPVHQAAAASAPCSASGLLYRTQNCLQCLLRLVCSKQARRGTAPQHKVLQRRQKLLQCWHVQACRAEDSVVLRCSRPCTLHQTPFSAYPHCPHGWLCTAGGSARDSSCCTYLRLDLSNSCLRLWHPILGQGLGRAKSPDPHAASFLMNVEMSSISTRKQVCRLWRVLPHGSPL
jgi:hypothetical protein